MEKDLNNLSLLGYAEPNGELFAVAGMSRPEGTWFSVAVDSGACENVANPEDVPDYMVTEPEASKNGRDFVSATGEVIPNLGELKLPAVTAENTVRGMTFSAAPVTKPLGSVKRICAAGHVVVFDEDGSYIINKNTGELNMLREEAGNYMLDLWIPPASDTRFSTAASFRRHP